jgi:hypothetical protein
MKNILIAIASTIALLFQVLATPIFFKWYQSYFKIGDGSMFGIIYVAIILTFGQMALVAFCWYRALTQTFKD